MFFLLLLNVEELRFFDTCFNFVFEADLDELRLLPSIDFDDFLLLDGDERVFLFVTLSSSLSESPEFSLVILPINIKITVTKNKEKY